MKHKLIAMTAAFLLSLTPLTAHALTEPIVPSVADGSVHFPRDLNAADFGLIVSSNQECTVTHAENGCTFTPEEDGRYVVSTSAYCEEIVSFGTFDTAGHFHYFYPVLTNYVVYVEDGEITVTEQGMKSWFSEEQIDAEVQKMNDAIAAGGIEVVACYDVYAAAPDDVMHGAYFSFINGQLSPVQGDYDSYITNVYTEYGTDSYFCVNYCSADVQPDMNGNEPQRVFAEEMDISSLLTYFWTSRTCDGNLTTPSPDMMEFTRIAAPEMDGDLTVLVDNLDAVYPYLLTVRDDIFHHRSGMRGDVNNDGNVSVDDAVMLQKWLLCKGTLICPQNADLTEEGRIDAFDLAVMKKMLIAKNTENTPDNMPDVIDYHAEVTDADRENLWTMLSGKYPDMDFSDFTFVYDPDHPLSDYYNGKLFSIYYKNILLHGYGNINWDASVFAIGGGNDTVNFVVDPKLFTQVDLDQEIVPPLDVIPTCIDVETPELILYVDIMGENPPRLAYRAVDVRHYGEYILDAVTGESIEYIPYYVV